MVRPNARASSLANSSADPTAGISDVLLIAATGPLHEASGRLLGATDSQTGMELEAATHAIAEIREILRRAATLTARSSGSSARPAVDGNRGRAEANVQ